MACRILADSVSRSGWEFSVSANSARNISAGGFAAAKAVVLDHCGDVCVRAGAISVRSANLLLLCRATGDSWRCRSFANVWLDSEAATGRNVHGFPSVRGVSIDAAISVCDGILLSVGPGNADTGFAARGCFKG